MLPISEASKKKWIIGTQAKTVTISFPNIPLTLTNANIVSESLSLTEELEQNKYLTFTGCIASRLSFKCNALNVDVRGQRIEVSIAIGTDSPIPIFKGFVDAQDNLTQRDVLTSISCYDDLVKINETDVTAWYKALTFPMTVAQFRASFWQHLGYTEEATTLPNDSLSLTKTVTDNVILAGKIAKWICQLNARYGKINRSGNFEYTKLTPITEGLYPANDLYPAEDLYPSDENFNAEVTNGTYKTITYEPYKTAPITGVYIWDNGGINQGQAGTAGNVLNIADNPLTWGVNMMTAAANIFAEVRYMQFIPATLKAVGMPYMETGDIVMIHTDDNLIRTYIMNRTLKGIQALADEYRCDSEQYLKVYKESVATAISSNDKNILKIQADIVQMNALIADRATIGQLNATNAALGNLEAIAITTQNLLAQTIYGSQISGLTINANQITSGKIKASQIDADSVSSTLFSSSLLKAQNVQVTGLGHGGYKLLGTYTTVTTTGGQSVYVPIATPA